MAPSSKLKTMRKKSNETINMKHVNFAPKTYKEGVL